MALTIFGFAAVPVYTGIAGKKEQLDNRDVAVTQNNSDALSFNEIYAIAAEDNPITADQLNAIEPAAGGSSNDDFSAALKESQHPAF